MGLFIAHDETNAWRRRDRSAVLNNGSEVVTE